ncbi:MAG: SDR family oxidoreductase, partial [Planctomycetaceae bacterium]|nr:SDR family oxidoreductase [Planctomycetaceae bacterium]
ADILLNDRPGSPDVAEAAAEIQKLGRTCHVVEANVFERAACEQLVEQSLELAGQIDILISNPAAGKRQGFLEYDPEDFERTIHGALVSGFHVSQLAARAMVARGAGGKIVFISSVHATLPSARCAAYNAAKAGLNHLATTIAVELCEHRINVNVIEPGWIETPGEHATFGTEAIRTEGAKLPWGRIGQPADIGQAAAFLCSDAADYITGTALRVDGGFTFRNYVANRVIPPQDS